MKNHALSVGALSIFLCSAAMAQHGGTEQGTMPAFINNIEPARNELGYRWFTQRRNISQDHLDFVHAPPECYP